MIEKKHKGARNELAAVCWLLDQGYEVFRNVSQHGPVDIIALKDGEINLFDVKSTSVTRFAPEHVIALGVKYLAVNDGEFEIFTPELKLTSALRECDWCGKTFNNISSNHKTRQFCSEKCKMKSGSIRRRENTDRRWMDIEVMTCSHPETTCSRMRAVSPNGDTWISDNIGNKEPVGSGEWVVIEHRVLYDIMEQAEAEGLTIKQTFYGLDNSTDDC